MKIVIGDILQSKAQTLVNTVNCVGVMGKGIALEFKKRFPEMFKDYVEKCKHNGLRPGIPYIYKTLFPPHVINFPTKDHWKSVSKIEDIEQGLQYILDHYKKWDVTSIAIPPLGCGNGQLEWKAVGPLLYKYAKQMDIPVEIYAPYGAHPEELTIKFLEQPKNSISSKREKYIQSNINPSWIALVEILHRIEKQPYHWPVGRTIFQKIAYVATLQGLPTGFVYNKGSFGPFSKDIKNAQTKLVNNNLLQEERAGNMFRVKVGPNYKRVRNDFRNNLENWKDIIEKVTDLFMRMNTAQAEIVATVMYATDNLKKENNKTPNEVEVLESVMQWKQKRRPPLEKSEVAMVIRNLGILRWLDIKPDNHLPISVDDYAIV